MRVVSSSYSASCTSRNAFRSGIYLQRLFDLPSTSQRRTASSAPPQNGSNLIDPNNLSATLEAHRAANRASLIHKVITEGDNVERNRAADNNALPKIRKYTVRSERYHNLQGRLRTTPNTPKNPVLRTVNTEPASEVLQEKLDREKRRMDNQEAYRDLVKDDLPRPENYEEIMAVLEATDAVFSEEQKKPYVAFYRTLLTLGWRVDSPEVVMDLLFDYSRTKGIQLEKEAHWTYKKGVELAKQFVEDGSFIAAEKAQLIQKWSLIAEQNEPLQFGTSRPDNNLAEQSNRLTPLGDYEGQYIRPKGNYKVARCDRVHQNPPWEVGRPKDKADEVPWLSKELKAFYNWVRPTEAELRGRQAVIEEVMALGKLAFPDYPLELFGSSATGLATATSDIDFRIVVPDSEWEGIAGDYTGGRHGAWTTRLNKIRRRFNHDPNFGTTELVRAVHPLIRCRHRHTGIEVQVVHTRHAPAASEFVRRHLEEFPGLSAVYTYASFILQDRGLHEVRNGGIGSYTLFNMIVGSFTQQDEPYLHNTEQLAEQVFHFFRFYSLFDHYNYGISVQPPEVFEKKPSDYSWSVEEDYRAAGDPIRLGRKRIALSVPDMQYLLCLQDPANPLNDLGRKSYAFKHVQATFAGITRAINNDVTGTYKPWTVDEVSYLMQRFGHIISDYQKYRERVGQYGDDVHRAVTRQAWEEEIQERNRSRRERDERIEAAVERELAEEQPEGQLLEGVVGSGTIVEADQSGEAGDVDMSQNERRSVSEKMSEFDLIEDEMEQETNRQPTKPQKSAESGPIFF